MFRTTLAGRRALALFDIGSASVGVAVLEMAPDSSGRVALAEHLELPLEERSSAQTIAALKQSLIDVGKRVLMRYIARPHALHISSASVVIRAPWSAAESVRAKTVLQEEEYVTERMIREVAKAALSRTSVPHKHFLEGSVMEVALNGYTTKRPEGKQTKEIEVAALISTCEPKMRAAVDEALGALLPVISHPKLHSGARALFEVLQTSPARSQECLILDIDAEGTLALVLLEGVIAQQSFVAEGTRSILTRLDASVSAQEALSLIRMIARDECTTAACEQAKAGLVRIEPELTHIFGEAFGALATAQRLPTRLVLRAHPDLVEWFSRFFSRIDFTQFTLTAQPFEVEVFPAVAAPAGSDDGALALGVAFMNSHTDASIEA